MPLPLIPLAVAATAAIGGGYFLTRPKAPKSKREIRLEKRMDKAQAKTEAKADKIVLKAAPEPAPKKRILGKRR